MLKIVAMPLIAPSILSANFLHLEQDIQMINASAADWFHIDVMDGRFVPNITFGMPIIAAMRKVAQKPFDVHLMIVEPERYITSFAEAGANVLTVHYEACTHLHRTLQAIKDAGMRAGVALNPHTPVQLLEPILTDIDVVCLMSVNPGFGGQKFIDATYRKVNTLKQMIIAQQASTLIEIDGGVTLDNIRELLAEGADVFVAGNTVFNSPSPTGTIKRLKETGK